MRNPRKRRRSRRFVSSGRIVINPSGGFLDTAKGITMAALVPAMAAIAGGAATGAIAGLVTSPILGALARTATGILGASLLRGRPAAAWSFFGATVGGFGMQIGAKLGGGLVAFTKGGIFKGLGDMATEDGEMAALLAGAGVEDIGDLIQLGDIADDESAMGDLVEQVAGLGDEEGVADDDSE
jgi:hypothetical protein